MGASAGDQEVRKSSSGEGAPVADALAALVPILAEDAIFAAACSPDDLRGGLDGIGKRRADAYNAALRGQPIARMTDGYDAWLVQLTRAMAPVAPPPWVPMMDVVREKVSLEIGARGLRSLFSTKPSDKDVARVKRFGTLAVRALRAVYLADGPLDAEESTTIASVIAALGLPEQEATGLYNEAPRAPDKLDTYADIEPAVARAVVRGAWLAAASDMIDPREDQAVRTMAHKLGMVGEHVEEARAEAQARVDARRAAGLAAVDGVRYVLSDRMPGFGVQLAALVSNLMLPRRHREEALAHVGHGDPVMLARRYASLPSDERTMVLAVAWSAALTENPTTSRTAVLRARWERLADDLGDGSGRGRAFLDEHLAELLGAVAKGMR
jgi:hypothetical protein